MSAGIGWIANILILHESETLAILHSYAVTGPYSVIGLREDRRQACHGDGHETDQDGHDAKSALDGHAVDFSDGSGRVRYGLSGT